MTKYESRHEGTEHAGVDALPSCAQVPWGPPSCPDRLGPMLLTGSATAPNRRCSSYDRVRKVQLGLWGGQRRGLRGYHVTGCGRTQSSSAA